MASMGLHTPYTSMSSVAMPVGVRWAATRPCAGSLRTVMCTLAIGRELERVEQLDPEAVVDDLIVLEGDLQPPDLARHPDRPEGDEGGDEGRQRDDEERLAPPAVIAGQLHQPGRHPGAVGVAHQAQPAAVGPADGVETGLEPGVLHRDPGREAPGVGIGRVDHDEATTGEVRDEGAVVDRGPPAEAVGEEDHGATVVVAPSADRPPAHRRWARRWRRARWPPWDAGSIAAPAGSRRWCLWVRPPPGAAVGTDAAIRLAAATATTTEATPSRRNVVTTRPGSDGCAAVGMSGGYDLIDRSIKG